MVSPIPILAFFHPKNCDEQQQQQQWKPVVLRNKKTHQHPDSYKHLLEQRFRKHSLANNPFFPLSTVSFEAFKNSIHNLNPTAASDYLSEPKRIKQTQSSIKSFCTNRLSNSGGRGGGGRGGGRVKGGGNRLEQIMQNAGKGIGKDKMKYNGKENISPSSISFETISDSTLFKEDEEKEKHNILADIQVTKDNSIDSNHIIEAAAKLQHVVGAHPPDDYDICCQETFSDIIGEKVYIRTENTNNDSKTSTGNILPNSNDTWENNDKNHSNSNSQGILLEKDNNGEYEGHLVENVIRHEHITTSNIGKNGKYEIIDKHDNINIICNHDRDEGIKTNNYDINFENVSMQHPSSNNNEGIAGENEQSATDSGIKNTAWIEHDNISQQYMITSTGFCFSPSGNNTLTSNEINIQLNDNNIINNSMITANGFCFYPTIGTNNNVNGSNIIGVNNSLSINTVDEGIGQKLTSNNRVATNDVKTSDINATSILMERKEPFFDNNTCEIDNASSKLTHYSTTNTASQQENGNETSNHTYQESDSTNATSKDSTNDIIDSIQHYNTPKEKMILDKIQSILHGAKNNTSSSINSDGNHKSVNSNSNGHPVAITNDKHIVFGTDIPEWNKGMPILSKNKRRRYQHTKTSQFVIGGMISEISENPTLTKIFSEREALETRMPTDNGSSEVNRGSVTYSTSKDTVQGINGIGSNILADIDSANSNISDSSIYDDDIVIDNQFPENEDATVKSDTLGDNSSDVSEKDDEEALDTDEEEALKKRTKVSMSPMATDPTEDRFAEKSSSTERSSLPVKNLFQLDTDHTESVVNIPINTTHAVIDSSCITKGIQGSKHISEVTHIADTGTYNTVPHGTSNQSYIPDVSATVTPMSHNDASSQNTNNGAVISVNQQESQVVSAQTYGSTQNLTYTNSSSSVQTLAQTQPNPGTPMTNSGQQQLPNGIAGVPLSTLHSSHSQANVLPSLATGIVGTTTDVSFTDANISKGEVVTSIPTTPSGAPSEGQTESSTITSGVDNIADSTSDTAQPIPGRIAVRVDGSVITQENNTSHIANQHTIKWSFEYQPKEAVNKFDVDYILGCLVTEVRKVDKTAYIQSWDGSNQAKILSHETLPKTASEMESYVEDPHTSKAGKHGRLYGRIQMVTNKTLRDLKKNSGFSSWIRHFGVFLEVSEIPSTRPKLIGFFDKSLPHASRIDLFKGYLSTVTTLSRPFQIFSQTIYADDDGNVKCFAYVMKCDREDADTLVKELASMRYSNFIKFYPWKEYKEEMDPTAKQQIVNDMTTASLGHASLVFKGVKSNDYMRIRNSKRTKENQETSEANTPMATDETAMENQKDLDFSHVRCLEFMQQHFVNSDRMPIFDRILGPYNNQIEVTFAQPYFNNVRIIEKQFVTILAARMTKTSIEKCFSMWPVPLTPDTLRNPWSPPPAINMNLLNNPSNSYQRPATQNIGYSLVSYQSTSTTLSYKDATTLGVRQVDMPSNLAALNVVNPIGTNRAIASTAMPSPDMTPSPFLIQLQENQRKYQEQNDLNLQQIRNTMAGVEAVAKEAKQSVVSLGVEVKAKYTEVQDTIKKSTRQSEERIAQNIAHQAAIQKEDTLQTQKMIGEVMTQLRLDREKQSEIQHRDTHMQHSNNTDIHTKGSERTNHPTEQNNLHSSIIHSSPRTNHHSNERVAALVN